MTRDQLAMELLKSLVLLPLVPEPPPSSRWGNDHITSIRMQTTYAGHREERVKLAYLYADEVIKQSMTAEPQK